MSELTCDVAVVGAGTAGLAAEREARKAGARTLLIDEKFAGTTCATVGCMPSKLLIAAADAAWSVRHAEAFGIHAVPEIDGPAVMKRLRAERDRFVAGVKQGMAKLPEGVCIKARASFCGPDRLQLDDGRTVAARAIVLATGASPSIPEDFAGFADIILTNETLFELNDLPRSIAVIGAGPLGLEMAQALCRLGVHVEVFDRGDALAGLRDPRVSEVLRDLLRAEFPVHLGVEPDLARGGDGITLRWNGETRDFERLLVAAGRPPNLDSLDLRATGLALDERGVPEFNRETLQCGQSGIFIAGDANHDVPLLHEAAHEGSMAGRNAASYPDVKAFRRHVAFALTFTRPEAAVIGDIPDPDDGDHAAADASYEDQGRARVEARLGGLCRLYARRRDGRLTGASLCAPDAGHLAHLIAWAIEADLTVADLLDMPLYHPTLEEGLKPALRSLCAAIGAPSDESRRNDAPCA